METGKDFREALAERLTQLPHLMPAVTDLRGIVIPAGGPYNRCAYHLVYALRQLGCRLPIQVWHLPQEADITWAKIWQAEGVAVVNAGEVAEREGVPVPEGGWQLKPFALRWCTFAKALLLDADNCPVRNPGYLFSDIYYEKRHAMFWPDLPPDRTRRNWVQPAVWREVGLTQDYEAMPLESGQVLVNRRRCMAELDLTVFLNEWHEHVYQFVYGDKDTFLLAWHLLGSKYHRPRLPSYRFPAICQHDSNGYLVFQHCTQGKADIAAGTPIESLINRRFIPDAATALEKRMKQVLTIHRHRGQQTAEATDGTQATA